MKIYYFFPPVIGLVGLGAYIFLILPKTTVMATSLASTLRAMILTVSPALSSEASVAFVTLVQGVISIMCVAPSMSLFTSSFGFAGSVLSIFVMFPNMTEKFGLAAGVLAAGVARGADLADFFSSAALPIEETRGINTNIRIIL